METDVAKLQDRIDELEVEVRGKDEEIGSLKTENAGLEEENDKLEGQVEDLEGKVEDLEEKLDFKEVDEYLVAMNELVEFVDFHNPYMGHELRERFDRVSFLQSMSRRD